MVFNATFKNISVIAWRTVLLVEETGVSQENRRPAASHWHLKINIAIANALNVLNNTMASVAMEMCSKIKCINELTQDCIIEQNKI